MNRDKDAREIAVASRLPYFREDQNIMRMKMFFPGLLGRTTVSTTGGAAPVCMLYILY